MYWRMAVDSESDVDFRKGSDSWLVLGVMARSVGWKATTDDDMRPRQDDVVLTKT